MEVEEKSIEEWVKANLSVKRRTAELKKNEPSNNNGNVIINNVNVININKRHNESKCEKSRINQRRKKAA